ncbi:hypothetical protein NDU88_006074 [Pleurodeles waltl]|uniref:Uncharacterized protein n=1 Tax=Pleurodeles waltl TaxID=8319 RepID=A0AAV7LPQ6_PLEWA|nr:hypothetical protein NDU88_006074 [Pleurodeles waltl]
MRSPPFGCSTVKRPRRPFWLSRWARQRSTRQAQWERPCNNEAGSEWSRRSCRGATGAVAPVVIFTVCKADSENHGGALLGAPCTAHASGMGSAGAPRGPTTPVPSILFLAVKTARNRMAGRGWESPCSAAMEIQPSRGKSGGKPPDPAGRLRLYSRGQNCKGSTASLLPVLPWSSTLAVDDRQG